MLRWAALLHDIGKPDTRRFVGSGRPQVTFHHHEVVGARLTKARLKALKFPKDLIDDIARLVFLHLRFYGYGRGEWTDSAVRRYVTDAGPLLDRLHKLVRSDTTTRNKRKAAILSATYDDLEERIARLREQEELDAIRPDLDGTEIMAILGIAPGPLVGKAYQHLLELRMEHGPLAHDEAVAALQAWYADARPDRRAGRRQAAAVSSRSGTVRRRVGCRGSEVGSIGTGEQVGQRRSPATAATADLPFSGSTSAVSTPAATKTTLNSVS